MKNKNRVRRRNTKPQQQGDEPNSRKISPVALRMEVTRIHFYERNPRHGLNPEYDRIKASIFSSGMDQPLLITQRPGADDYIVQAGGNTRLRILQELYESTGEERFHWVDCLFIEWDRESTVLLAHLRENELRGNLSFIDKARAVFDIKAVIANELGVGDVSQRQLETILKDHGYSVSYELISTMHYAVTVLLPLLPDALDAGLGKPQVKRIRNLERVGREIWSLRKIEAELDFDAAFEALCRRYDGANWQFDSLRQGIENEIAEASAVSVQVIRMELDCRLAGRALDIPDFVHEQEGGAQSGEFPKSSRDEPAIASMAERKAEAITSSAQAAERSRSDTTRVEDSSTAETGEQRVGPPHLAVDIPVEANHENLFRQIGVQSKARLPIELLRESAYTLAQRLANRHGFGDLVTQVRDVGLGFLVRDIPSPLLMNQLDDDMLAEVTTTWWQLIAFAEITVAPANVVAPRLDAESALCAAVLGGENNRLLDKVWTVDPAHLARRFWRQLNHADWCDWLCLAHTYRELHRMACMLNTPLWSTKE